MLFCTYEGKESIGYCKLYRRFSRPFLLAAPALNSTRSLIFMAPTSRSQATKHQIHGAAKPARCKMIMLCARQLRLPTRRIDGAGISTTAQSTDNHSMAQASTVPKRRRRARGGAGVEGLASRGHGREPLGAPTH